MFLQIAVSTTCSFSQQAKRNRLKLFFFVSCMRPVLDIFQEMASDAALSGSFFATQ